MTNLGLGETFFCAAAPPLCGTLCVNNMEINELNFSGEADDVVPLTRHVVPRVFVL